ncbi:hypothetical protein FACS1894163_00820 [Spirochaetia bacterium]|nr:hypothetical protein FACS1894163_00820 [Spirochaetia bacterium]
MKTRMALLLISVLLLTQCNNFIHELIPLEPGEELPQPPAILTFKTIGPVTAIGVIDQAALTITVNVPNGTDVTNMTTDITTLPAEATLSPSRNGPTNFSAPVFYTVSDGGISKTYLVTVIVGTAPPPVIYMVTFDKNNGDIGGTEANPQRMPVEQDGVINPLPAAPARPGYTFTGWNRAANGSGTVFNSLTSVTVNITVYAQWRANAYTVTFDKNGGDTDASPASNTSTYGGTVPLPTTDPTWAGHAFEGWWTKNGGDWGEAFTASTPVTQNITVYAKWNPPPSYYTVTFNKNNTDSGSTEADPQTAPVADGGTVNPLPTQPARTGYTFGGWNTAINGRGTVFDATTTVTGNITVYAKWTINTYTVTFDKNNTDSGSTEASPNTLGPVTHGGTVTLPTQPTRTGYTFADWNTAVNGSGTVFDATTTVTGNITVYAQWTINTYTVTFDKNNTDSGSTEGSPNTLGPVTHGGTVTLPAEPARTGYTFAGWNTAADGNGTAFDATNVVTATITVYAQWTINTYTVTFDKNGGDTDASPTSNTTTYGGTVPLPTTDPIWSGYTFLSWWTENGSGGDWGTEFDASTPVTEDITVYAKWVIIPSPSLKLVINGSSGSFIIPTNNVWPYDWTIDWGDGNIEAKTRTGAVNTGISHTYVPNPEYTIEITANSSTGHAAFGFLAFETSGSNAMTNRQKLLKALGHIKENTSVVNFPNAWKECFHLCTNLNEISPDLLPNVDNGTSNIFYAMFTACWSLASLPDGFQLPAVPNGTSYIFFQMFSDCTSLSSLPDEFQLPAVPNGTDNIFVNMFRGCSGLSSLPDGFQLPAVPNGTSGIFGSMFWGCSGLSSLPDGFQLPAVPNGTSGIFANMFWGCSGLSSLPDGFQLPAVPNGTSGIFTNMFNDCSVLSTNIENLISRKIFSSGQQNNGQFMGNTFVNCSNLTGSALNALSMGFYGNTTTTPSPPTTDLNTFYRCTNLSDYSSLNANWK